MRPPPPVSDLPRFPIVGGTALLAIGVTIAYHFRAGRRLAAAGERARPPGRDLAVRHVDPAARRAGSPPVQRLLALDPRHGAGGGVRPRPDAGDHSGDGDGVRAAQYALDDGGIGLSGVVYMDVGNALRPRPPRPAVRRAVDYNTNVVFVVWFFLCIAGTAAGSINIGNVAHGSGRGRRRAARPRRAWPGPTCVRGRHRGGRDRVRRRRRLLPAGREPVGKRPRGGGARVRPSGKGRGPRRRSPCTGRAADRREERQRLVQPRRRLRPRRPETGGGDGVQARARTRPGPEAISRRCRKTPERMGSKTAVKTESVDQDSKPDL